MKLIINNIIFAEIEYGFIESSDRSSKARKPFLNVTFAETMFDQAGKVKSSYAGMYNQIRTLEKIHNRQSSNPVHITGSRCVVSAIKLINKVREKEAQRAADTQRQTMENQSKAQTTFMTQGLAPASDEPMNHFEELARIHFEEKKVASQALNVNNYPQSKPVATETDWQALSVFAKEITDLNLSTKVMPVEGKRMSDYEVKGPFNTQKKSNAHAISFLAPKHKNDNDFNRDTRPTVLFKEYNGNAIADIEAYNSLCYRFELGDRAPEMNVLYDTDNTRLGVIITYYPNFQSLQDFEIAKRGPITESEIIEYKYADVWFAALNRFEHDMHDRNIGTEKFQFNDDKRLAVKLDHDQSTIQIASEYLDITQKRLEEIKGHYQLTAQELSEFPVIQTRRNAWVGQYVPIKDPRLNALSMQKQKTLKKIRHNKTFRDQAMFAALRRALIPDAMFDHAAQATVSSSKLKNELAYADILQTQNLRAILPDLPEFKEFLLTNPDALNQLSAQFEAYNFTQLNPKLRFDMKVVRELYQMIKTITLANQEPVAIKSAQTTVLPNVNYQQVLTQLTLAGEKIDAYIKSRTGFLDRFVLNKVVRNPKITEEKIALAKDVLLEIKQQISAVEAAKTRNDNIEPVLHALDQFLAQNILKCKKIHALEKDDGQLDRDLSAIQQSIRAITSTLSHHKMGKG